jgi:predicted nucleic acid-binding protein
MIVFIDSSILVEYIKGNNTELFDYLLESDTKLVSNPIVFSEYIFYFLALAGNKSPLAIKEKSKIPGLLKENYPLAIFSTIEILKVDENITVLSFELMQKHNLLPNDALILATLKLNEIKYLVSFDKNDFEKPCKKESIKLIKSVAELKHTK